MSGNDQKADSTLSHERRRLADNVDVKETSLCQKVFDNRHLPERARGRERQAKQDLERLWDYERLRDQQMKVCEGGRVLQSLSALYRVLGLAGLPAITKHK